MKAKRKNVSSDENIQEMGIWEGLKTNVGKIRYILKIKIIKTGYKCAISKIIQ
jgi:hypothetical protein